MAVASDALADVRMHAGIVENESGQGRSVAGDESGASVADPVRAPRDFGIM
jgi:hypothetical protein